MSAGARWLASLSTFALVACVAFRGYSQVRRHQFAVVVGANRATDGHQPLRYAHSDARAFAAVLTEASGVERENVVLLLDPHPSEVLAALDRALGRAAAAGPDSLLFFYYSGHADQGSLYPGGEPLPLSALRPRLADSRAPIRVGIIDACRGGGWTGSKGLSAAEPFAVDVSAALSSEGSVLIASSSGLENAHEGETLQGSFFTHHWNAGLRGAADGNADGKITVNEVFEYARALTIRDTALVTEFPQHPSFRMDLAGRDDLVLAVLDRARVTLTIRQVHGPLQLIHLSSGVVVAESPPGPRDLRLALQPGRYLVRRRDAAGTVALAVDVGDKREMNLAESDLEPAADVLLDKSSEAVSLDSALAPAGRWETQLALGVRHAPIVDPGLRVTSDDGGAVAMLRAVRGFKHFHAALPLAFAFEIGDDPVVWIPWAGLPVVGLSSTGMQGFTIQGVLGAGADLRALLGPGRSLNASLSGLGSWQWTANEPVACVPGASPCPSTLPTRRPPDTWAAQATVGYSQSVGDRVTFNLGVGAGVNLLFAGRSPAGGWDAAQRGFVVSMGSVQRRGLLALPLVRIRLTNDLSVDGHVAVAYVAAERGFEDTYLAGFTRIW
jgi:Caspase domain